MFLLIGLRRLERGADHLSHAVRKPPLKPDIYGQYREYSHQNGRYQGNHREHAGQPQVQPRSGRMRPPRGNHFGDPLQHQCRDHKNIDQIGQQHQPQAGCVCPFVQRAKDNECGNGQYRPQQHKTQSRRVLHTSTAPQTA